MQPKSRSWLHEGVARSSSMVSASRPSGHEDFVAGAPPSADGHSEATVVLNTALAYLRAGLSLIPIKRDGSKTPASRLLPCDEETGKATWKPFQKRLPAEARVRTWFDRTSPPG